MEKGVPVHRVNCIWLIDLYFVKVNPHPHSLRSDDLSHCSALKISRTPMLMRAVCASLLCVRTEAR